MKAVSSLVAVILILLIGMSLVSSLYIFFSGVIRKTTETGSDIADQVSSSLLAEMKIDSFDTAGTGSVDILNTGKVNLTNFVQKR